jgi:hypothetical protein
MGLVCIKAVADNASQVLNATSRRRKGLKAHQDAHHIKATGSIKPRVYHRILHGLSMATSPHDNILTTRAPGIEHRVPSDSLCISECKGTSKLSTLIRLGFTRDAALSQTTTHLLQLSRLLLEFRIHDQEAENIRWRNKVDANILY